MSHYKMGAHPLPYVPRVLEEEELIVLGNESESNMTTFAPFKPNTTDIPLTQSVCQWILFSEIASSGVRIWDLIILVPNAVFLAFLLIYFRTAISKLRRTSSPIFLAFYGMVFVVVVISVLRCVVSMTVSAALPAEYYVDEALWLTVRFFLLATELSVVVFGLAFGHLDSRTSIQRVLLVTFSVALVYSTTQGVLEFLYDDEMYHDKSTGRMIFGHGGMLFLFASSIFFFVVYAVVCILPWTSFRERFAMPSKKSFYVYCGFLAVLNLVQAIGSGLLYYHVNSGLCVVDLTTYIYFTGFAPMVYSAFLWDFFRTSQPTNILFSYKPQTDDGEEDTLSLPQQASASIKSDSDVMTQSFDSTHFDSRSPNPLYGGDMPLPMPHAELSLSINADYFDDPRDEEGEQEDAALRRHVIT